MKTIFLRHASLEYPYNNYQQLSLDELDLLATEKVQPRIDRELAKVKIKEQVSNGLLTNEKVDIIYHSSANRAEETAGVMADILDVEKLEELDCFKEISFSPKKFISAINPRDDIMETLRNAVYNSIEHNTADEDNESILDRLHKVKELISKQDDRTVVIITHGFFMRLLQIFLLEKKYTFSAIDQKKATNYSNLQGFIYISQQK